MEDRLQDLSGEHNRSERELREIEEIELTRTDALSLVEECRELLHDLPGTLDASSPEVRVRTIRRCVQRVVVDPDSGNAEVWINALRHVDILAQRAKYGAHYFGGRSRLIPPMQARMIIPEFETRSTSRERTSRACPLPPGIGSTPRNHAAAIAQ